MNSKFLSVFSAVFRRPLAVSLCGLIITLFFAAAIPHIKFDNDIKNFLSLDHPHRVALEYYDGIFGTSEMIFIGVESGNAFSTGTVEYVKWLSSEIEKLNWGFPAGSISSELGFTTDEANRLIDIINQNEVYGHDALTALLSDPEGMTSRLFIEPEFAGKIASAAKRVSPERILQLYRFPADEIRSVLNTDYIRGEGSRFVVEKLIDRDNITAESVAAMKGRVKSWPLYDKMLFSSDGRLTVLSVQMNRIDINLRQKFNLAIENLIKENPKPGLTVYMAGEPVLADRVSGYMSSDLQRLLPFVLLVMMFILIVIFRHYEGVILPMAAMIITVIWTLGTMPLLGIPMSMVSTTVPIVLTSVASAYGIHFMTHYYMSSCPDRMAASLDSIRVSGLAIIMAALTTVAGFGSLVTSDMTHIRNYGIVTAIGVFYSLVISLTFIPAVICLRKGSRTDPGFVEEKEGKWDLSSSMLRFIRVKTGKSPWLVLGGGVLITVLSLFAMTSLELSMNSMDFFKEGSDVKVAENVLNERLAGTQLLDINIESVDGSEIITPAVLSKIEDFQRDIAVRFPDVGKTIAVTDYLKKMNREMHGGEENYNRLPESQQMTREFLLLYSGDIDGIVDKSMDRLRIHLNIKRGKISEQMRIREYALSYFDGDFMKQNRVRVESSGYMDLIMEANLLIVKGQISSLLTSFIIVAILMYIILRSVKLTVISLLPLVTGIAMNFGIMGFLNIPLNAVTAVVPSIAIGMGIDYSIHFISQYRNILKSSGGIDKAIEGTYSGTGRAILSNMVSVMSGFAILLFSEFPIIRQYGGLIAFTVFVTGFAAIIILPAALRVLWRFENRKEKSA